ncbi:hypothetical protein DMUE_4655 [Dictyocoela muelleri]|nr:hypothetical protein DMUE_4655 [Dictyocoela muelleri]
MCPEEAIKEENWNKVKEHQENYKKEFGKIENDKTLNVGTKVSVKKEIKKDKMDKEFDEMGEIVGIIGNNRYLIMLNSGIDKVKHSSQLKAWRGNVKYMVS